MTTAEFLTIGISLIAATISLVSLIRTRKTAEEQLKLEKITADLAQKQLLHLEFSERERSLPKILIILSKLGNGYNFLVTNRGDGSAFDLKLDLIDCKDSPLSSSEIAEKFPFPELKPNSRIKLLAAIHMNSPRIYDFQVSWNDSSGNEHIEKQRVTL